MDPGRNLFRRRPVGVVRQVDRAGSLREGRTPTPACQLLRDGFRDELTAAALADEPVDRLDEIPWQQDVGTDGFGRHTDPCL